MKKTLFASALLLGSAAATAGDFNYTYGEVGYGEGRGDGDGLFLVGAVDLKQGFGIIGSYYALDYDAGRFGDRDLDIFTVGVQFHTPLNEQTDFVGSIQLINADVDWGRGNDDDTGVLLRGGIRFAIQQNLQLEGDISYNTNDYWDDDEFGIKVGLRYFVAPELSLAAGGASDQELDGLYVSGRYDFR